MKSQGLLHMVHITLSFSEAASYHSYRLFLFQHWETFQSVEMQQVQTAYIFDASKEWLGILGSMLICSASWSWMRRSTCRCVCSSSLVSAISQCFCLLPWDGASRQLCACIQSPHQANHLASYLVHKHKSGSSYLLFLTSEKKKKIGVIMQ